MKRVFCFCFLLFLSMICLASYAASPDSPARVASAGPANVTVSALTCSPASVNVGQTATCSATFKNTGGQTATGLTFNSLLFLGAGSVGSASGCSATLNPGDSCTEQFIYTAPSTYPGHHTANNTGVELRYSGTAGLPASHKVAQVIILAGAGNIYASALTCTPSAIDANKTASCSVTFTNRSTTTKATQVSITPSATAGSVGTQSGCGSTIAKHNGSCTATFTYTAPNQAKSSVTVSVAFSDEQHDSVSPPTTTLTVFDSDNGTIKMGAASCTPTAINVNQTLTCTTLITNQSEEQQTGLMYSLYTNLPLLVQPTASTNCAAIAGNGTCTETFSFTLPKSSAITTLSGNMRLNFKVEQHFSPVATRIKDMTFYNLTAGILSCSSTDVKLGDSANCTLVFTNHNDTPVSGGSVNIIATPSTISHQQGCSQTIDGTNHCTVTFKYKAPPPASKSSIGAHPLLVNYLVGGDVLLGQSTSMNILSDNVAVSALTCSPTILRASQQATCNVTFTNISGSSLSDAVVAVTVPDLLTKTMVSAPCASPSTLQSGHSCTENFTVKAPATISASAAPQIVVNFSDSEGDTVNAKATVILSLPKKSTGGIEGSVLPPLPKHYVAPNDEISIKINFLNKSTTNTYYFNPHVYALSHGSVLSGLSTTGSCTTADPQSIPAGGTAACNLVVSNFKPENFPGLSVGDTVTFYAVLDYRKTSGGSNAHASNIVSWPVLVGKQPIYARVMSNRLFITGDSAPFEGAFVFENNSNAAITNLQSVDEVLPTGFAGTPCANTIKFAQYSSCAGTNLAVGDTCAACFIANNDFQPGSIKQFTFSGQLRYAQSTAKAKRTFQTNPHYRKFTIKNNCTSSVWVAFVSGAAYHYCNYDSECPAGTKCMTSAHQCQVPGGSTSCGSGCATGTYCTPNNKCSAGCNAKPGVCPNYSHCNAANGLCYWSLPTYHSSSPASDASAAKKMQIKPAATAVFRVPNAALTTGGYVWSGGLVGRTGCTGVGSNFSCLTGNCPNPTSNHACPLGVGPEPPATQAEFTLQLNAEDYYDVEIIDGFNIPLSMKPDSGNTSAQNAYVCRAAGAPITATVNGNSTSNVCPWQFTMIAPTPTHPNKAASARYVALHNYVTSGGQSCLSGYTCTGGLVCGISQKNANPASGSPTLTCGNLIGFWSTSKLCSFNPSAYNTDLSCQASSGGVSKTNWLGCNAGVAKNSCYSSTASAGQCCGCPYWSAWDNQSHNTPPTGLHKIYSGIGLKVLYPNANNDYCKAHTDYWVNSVLTPDLIWMKRGCSSVYTFAYDDATSTFTCNSASGSDTVNKQNYTFTFCPGSNAGKVNGNGIYMPPDS